MNKPLILSLLGLLFSGYLVLSKYLGDSCVLASSCYYFFGVPTCVFGFVGFLLLTGHLIANINKGAFVIAVLGFLMAMIFTVLELLDCPECEYALGMPTCFYGGLLFGLIAWMLKDYWGR